MTRYVAAFFAEKSVAGGKAALDSIVGDEMISTFLKTLKKNLNEIFGGAARCETKFWYTRNAGKMLTNVIGQQML